MFYIISNLDYVLLINRLQSKSNTSTIEITKILVGHVFGSNPNRPLVLRIQKITTIIKHCNDKIDKKCHRYTVQICRSRRIKHAVRLEYASIPTIAQRTVTPWWKPTSKRIASPVETLKEWRFHFRVLCASGKEDMKRLPSDCQLYSVDFTAIYVNSMRYIIH